MFVWYVDIIRELLSFFVSGGFVYFIVFGGFCFGIGLVDSVLYGVILIFIFYFYNLIVYYMIFLKFVYNFIVVL